MLKRRSNDIGLPLHYEPPGARRARLNTCSAWPDADLRNTDLSTTKIWQADTHGQRDPLVRYNDATMWPDGFDPGTHGGDSSTDAQRRTPLYEELVNPQELSAAHYFDRPDTGVPTGGSVLDSILGQVKRIFSRD